MRTGIDANGRSFRWMDGDEVECLYAIAGTPFFGQGAGRIWNNPGAADPTCYEQAVSLNLAWDALDYIRKDPKHSSDADSNTVLNADCIAEAIAQILPENALAPGIVLTIPNMLSEDGQFQLISALENHRLYNSFLLWRSVALALAWSGDAGGKAMPLESKKRSLWVYDFESVNLEVTCFRWKRVRRNNIDFICPVRDYPTGRQWRNDFRSHDAAFQVAQSVVMPKSADSLLTGMYAGAFQRNLEMGQQNNIVLYQDESDSRRWKRLIQSPALDVLQLQRFEQEINNLAVEHADDIIVVHGWPARQMRFACQNIVKMDANAIVQGAGIFSRRLENRNPPYFDTLPEYRIWAEHENEDHTKAFNWFTVINKGEVEANCEWVASRDSDPIVKNLLTNISIAQHKNRLRLFVQNKTRFEDDKNESPESNAELARRLTQPLTATTRNKVGISFEFTAKPASGHAVVTVSVKKEQHKMLLADGRPATFSWKSAESEHEHKGFLNSMDIVGRIMDPVNSPVAESYNISSFKEMAWLAIKHLNSIIKPDENILLQTCINAYRPGNFIIADMPNDQILNWILKYWGYTQDPLTSQPTRGLFGTRKENDPELFQIAAEFTNYIRTNYMNGSGNWWKYQNYLYAYASDEYKDDVRQRLSLKVQPANTTFSEIYAPGYVLSAPEDLMLLIRFSEKSNVHRDKQYWSFFRSVCWHDNLAGVPVDLALNYLRRMLEYFEHAPFPNPEEKKYGLHALLFALKMRNTKHKAEFDQLLNGSHNIKMRFNDLLTHGCLSNVVPISRPNPTGYPPSMLAGMGHMTTPGDNFSKFVRRFLNYEDTLKDREIGSGISTS